MNASLFVENIKKFCASKGIKPTTACKESGVGTSFISDVNRGQTPSVAKVQMLADYLGVTTSELLGETDKKSPAPIKGDGTFSEKYDQLSPENRAAIDAVLDRLLASQSDP